MGRLWDILTTHRTMSRCSTTKLHLALQSKQVLYQWNYHHECLLMICLNQLLLFLIKNTHDTFLSTAVFCVGSMAKKESSDSQMELIWINFTWYSRFTNGPHFTCCLTTITHKMSSLTTELDAPELIKQSLIIIIYMIWLSKWHDNIDVEKRKLDVFILLWP